MFLSPINSGSSNISTWIVAKSSWDTYYVYISGFQMVMQDGCNLAAIVLRRHIRYLQNKKETSKNVLGTCLAHFYESQNQSSSWRIDPAIVTKI